MPRLILNIGLATDATSFLAAEVVEQILTANDYLIHRRAVRESDTEPTLVVEVSGGHPASPYRTAYDLRQDCIAVWNPATQEGSLEGPQSHKWGLFDPTRFVLMNGKRLAPQPTTQE